MKILHLISSSGYYGAEKVLVELSRAAAQAPEIDKTYAGIICNSANPHTEICSALRGSGVLCVLFACSGKLDISTVKEIRSFIKKEKIDVIHSHGYKSNFYALAATLFLKVKKITTVHNWITTGSTSSCSSAEVMFIWMFISRPTIRSCWWGLAIEALPTTSH